MVLSWLLIVVGLALLVAGGEALVRGASGIALLSKLTPTVVGLTVVAAGTSMPEMVVSVQAGLAGSPDLAVGNVVGSNIFNAAAILGIAALVQPLRIHGNTVRMEWPVMMLGVMQLHLLGRDGVVDRLEGGFLFLAMIAFTAYVVWIGRKAATEIEQQEYENLTTASFGRTGTAAWAFNGLAVAAGVGLLVGGSTALVHGATAVARGLGVTEAIIGLTVVAAGTSTPELAASAVAAYRGKDDIAVANVIGSNIYNTFAIIGVTGLIHPLSVAEEILVRDNWWMIGFSAALLPLMVTGMRVNRWEGAALLTAFVGYLGMLIAGA